jgi:hypothetical protein
MVSGSRGTPLGSAELRFDLLPVLLSKSVMLSNESPSKALLA